MEGPRPTRFCPCPAGVGGTTRDTRIDTPRRMQSTPSGASTRACAGSPLRLQLTGGGNTGEGEGASQSEAG
eukprot:10436422-Alexandrium_andersonii.AAC.1